MHTGSLLDSYNIQRTVDPTIEPITMAETLTHIGQGAVVNLDTGESASSSDFDNTTDPLTVSNAVTTYTGISFRVGLMLKIEDEVMEVTEVDGNDVTIARGILNTEVRSHADNQPILQSTTNELYIADLIPLARHKVETDTWSALTTQTWTVKYDYAFPAKIVVPRPPLQSVSSITYIDTSEDSQTLAATEYDVVTHKKPGEIVPTFNDSWPTTRGYLEDVTVTFVAGYGDNQSDVPMPLRHALKLLIGHLYQNREAILVGSITKELELAYKSLISPYSYVVPF